MTEHEKLLQRWLPTIRYSSKIWTWTEDLTLAYLAELASQATLIVESGTYLGRSAKVMLDANSQAHVWTVDKFMVAGIEHTARHFLRNKIAGGRCEIIVGDSERAAQMLEPYRGKIDLVFVDDGHAEEDLKRDIRCLLPLLRKGGVICGHDWEGDNDVARGVKAMLPLKKLTFPVPRLWQYVMP